MAWQSAKLVRTSCLPSQDDHSNIHPIHQWIARMYQRPFGKQKELPTLGSRWLDSWSNVDQGKIQSFPLRRRNFQELVAWKHRIFELTSPSWSNTKKSGQQILSQQSYDVTVWTVNFKVFHMLRYCWWTKSCTTKDDDYPIIYRVLTIPGGCLGFCPSTVWPENSFLKQIPNPLRTFPSPRWGGWPLPTGFGWAYVSWTCTSVAHLTDGRQPWRDSTVKNCIV